MTLLYLFWGYLTWECLLQNHFSGDPRWVGLPNHIDRCTGPIWKHRLWFSWEIIQQNGVPLLRLTPEGFCWCWQVMFLLKILKMGISTGFFIVFEPCQTRGDPDPLVFYCFWAVSSQKRSWCILRLEDDSPLKFLRLSGSKGQTVDLLDTYKVRSQKDS